MKFKIQKPSPTELQIGIAYLIIGALGIGITYATPDIFQLLPPCLFKSMTGIPCPACGTTHAGYYLSRFRFRDGFLSNPLFFILFLGLALWGINTVAGLVLRKSVTVALTNKEKRILRIVLLLALPVNWLYMILVTLLHSGMK